MESYLREIWPYIESIGIPILAIIGGISFFSLNFYWRTCYNLRNLEEHIKRNKTSGGFIEKTFPAVGLRDIFYGFKPISKFDEGYFKIEAFQESLGYMIAFRKFYRIVFPIVISLAAIGITINELVIDK
jgi:hypothetical protein